MEEKHFHSILQIPSISSSTYNLFLQSIPNLICSMKRKAFSLSSFSSAVQISECVPSSCSKNLKKPKILDKVNSMAAKASDSNWPPLLDEKMLEVFIAAHLRAMRSGPHLNSHSLEFWNKAETEVNRIITENFPQLLPKDVESLRKRLKYLRCNPKVSNFSSLTSEDNFLWKTI